MGSEKTPASVMKSKPGKFQRARVPRAESGDSIGSEVMIFLIGENILEDIQSLSIMV